MKVQYNQNSYLTSHTKAGVNWNVPVHITCPSMSEDKSANGSSESHPNTAGKPALTETCETQ